MTGCCEKEPVTFWLHETQADRFRHQTFNLTLRGSIPRRPTNLKEKRMFVLLFYIVIGWIVFSFAAGGYKYLSMEYPTFNDAHEAAVHMLKLPYVVVKSLFKK